MSDPFSCGICYQLYDTKNKLGTPHILKRCAHDFCLLCLNNISTVDYYSEKKIICPVCRQESKYNRSEKILKSYVYIKVLDAYKKKDCF